MPNREIKIRLPIEDIDRLDAEASFHETSRAEIVRRYLNPSGFSTSTLNTEDYYKLVSVVRKRTGNSIAQRQLETVVTQVLLQLRD